MDAQRSTSNHLDRRTAATVVGVALVYFACAKAGLSLAFSVEQVTAVWPPTGVAVAAYILFGYRVWPGVLLGAFAINATLGESLTTAAGIALGNTLGAIVGLRAARRFSRFDDSITRVRDVIAFACIVAGLGAAVSATNGVLNLVLGGVVPASEFGSVWWVWWVGDAMGAFVFGPFLLAWWRNRRLPNDPARLFEMAILYLVLSGLCHVVLDGDVIETPGWARLRYSIFPLVIWAGLRFGQREASTAGVLISAFSVWGAIHDRGPFVDGTLDQRLIQLEVFVAATVGTGLVLGAVESERRIAESAVLRSREELELRVRDRTAELASANAELARKNEEIEAFVYIVSHDLRAPLVNLQGFSKELDLSCHELDDLLASTSLPPAVAQRVRSILEDDVASALRYISASTSRFQRLIDALLLLSRHGRQEYRADQVDVGALVTTTVDSLRFAIDTRRAAVKVESLPSATGDETAIGQVFSNLISNALNYLDPGRTGVIVVGGTTDGQVSHYWVRDNGLGIPASARPRLFQVFQRFHPERSVGEGMGLAVVKRVVERHGGTIWAESEEGVGSTFHLTLPSPQSRRG